VGLPDLFFTGLHLRPSCPLTAAIFLRAAADIVRLGLGLAVPIWVFELLFAHRAFCARLIFLRAAADRVRRFPGILPVRFPRAADAAPKRFTSPSALARALFNCWTTPDRFAMKFSPGRGLYRDNPGGRVGQFLPSASRTSETRILETSWILGFLDPWNTLNPCVDYPRGRILFLG
jgi:hypothetical protein